MRTARHASSRIRLAIISDPDTAASASFDETPDSVRIAILEDSAEGISLDEPVRTSGSGNVLTYITDPWGTRVESIQRGPLGPRVQ
jgi:hypothetical protein